MYKRKRLVNKTKKKKEKNTEYITSFKRHYIQRGSLARLSLEPASIRLFYSTAVGFVHSVNTPQIRSHYFCCIFLF